MFMMVLSIVGMEIYNYQCYIVRASLVNGFLTDSFWDVAQLQAIVS